MHPALDFLTSRVLTWTPLYGYHVSQNVDRFLRKRHPDIGKKSLSAMLPNPIFSAIGLHPNRKMSKEIGFDNFVKPNLAWKIFRQPCRKVPPAGGIGDRGFPLQARFDIKTLCLPTHEPTGDGVVSMPIQIFPGLRFWPKYEIFQEHTILFSHLAISVYRIWYCLFREHWTLSCDRWTQWDVPYLKFLGHRLRFES